MLIGTIAGTAIGVVSLVGLALYLVGPGQRGSTVAADDPLDQTAGSLASAITNAPDRPDDDDRARSESENYLRADGDEVPENGRGPATGEEADPGDDDDQLATTVPAPTIEAPEEDEINESEPRALLDPALRPAAELQIDGVFALNDTMLDRVGGYVAVNDLVFTSASALGGRDRAVLLADGIWAEATVTGVDRITDVAVLEVTETVEDQDFLAVATMAPVDPNGEYVFGTPGAEIHFVVPGLGEGETLTGMVLSNQKQTTAHDGTWIYGGMQTTLVQPDGSPGSAIYNDTQDIVVGMIINSSEYLTTAISIDRVLEVGRSFVEWGVPAIEWLGITGTNLETGGVVLTEVDETGPAATSGLQVEDVIVAFNGTDVLNLDHLVYLIRDAGVDNLVLIAYQRQDQRLETEATVGTIPVEASAGS